MVEIAFDPTKWQRRIVFKSKLPDTNYVQETTPENYLRKLIHLPFNESFSDNCMMEIMQGPTPLTNACKISPICRKVMVDDPNFGSGYGTTHR